MLVLVKKWLRTKHAFMFRLNNKVVQVCFKDNSQIILCSDSRLVSYISRAGAWQTLTLQEALDSSNQDMVKRLRYTKDIVETVIGTRGGAALGPQQARPLTTAAESPLK